jgi:transposase IS66 family protein/uncharacterized protein DUF6444
VLQEANARLRAENAELKAQLAEQAEKIARLERLISRNSGNSSMPPSTDDLPRKKPAEPKTRRGGGRRPGKQPGAPGACLAWDDRPDQVQDVFPEGWCACGGDLAAARDLGVRFSHQVTDLPEARAVTIQYDRHQVECACGQVHVADAPPEAAGAPGTVTYGLNFQAWCVFLMVMHHVPVERCADILKSMSGTRPSDGWVHTLLDRAARAVAAANQAIRALIILAGVICGDETPLRAGPSPKTKKKYLLVACTNLLTYYFLGDRDLPSFKDFVYSDLHGTVVVHDRYVNYDHFAGISHQLCTAHYPDMSTCSGTSKTPPSPTRTRPGPARSPASCAPSSTRRTLPATPAWTPCPTQRSPGTCACSGTASTPACHRSAAWPARKASSRPPCTCWSASSTAKPTCSGSCPTPPSRPPPTRPNAICDQQRPSRRSAAGSAQSKLPATGTPSGATPRPPPSTDTRSSPPSATPSPETPGYRPSPPSPELHPKPVTHGNPRITHAPRRECLPSEVGQFLSELTIRRQMVDVSGLTGAVQPAHLGGY